MNYTSLCFQRFINYKIPKIENEPAGTDLAEGKAYAYITAPGSSWKLSSKSITSGSSMLENTMNNFYSNKQVCFVTSFRHFFFFSMKQIYYLKTSFVCI